MHCPKKRDDKLEISRVYLPYLNGVTDKVGTILKKYAIKTLYRPFSIVAKYLSTKKAVIPLQPTSIYKVFCSSGSFYIEQNKKTIADSVNEHIIKTV